MCKYKREYYNVISDEVEEYECDEEPVEDGYCIFHHPNYWKTNKEDFVDKFMKKVHEHNKNNKPLKCIGYHFPKIDLSNTEFQIPINFAYSIFHSNAIFFRAKFKEVNFQGAVFEGEAKFKRTVFNGKVSFFGVTFKDANFRKARFQSGVDFSYAIFVEHVDFYRTYFDGKKTNFYKAKFGMVDFKRSTFSSKVNFSNANFYSYASFIRSYFKKKRPILTTLNF